MRNIAVLSVATFILALSLGCAGSITKEGLSGSMGSARVESEKSIVSSDGFTEGFMTFAEKTVGLIVDVAKFFLPGGFQQPQAAAAATTVPPHTHTVGLDNPVAD